MEKNLHRTRLPHAVRYNLSCITSLARRPIMASLRSRSPAGEHFLDYLLLFVVHSVSWFRCFEMKQHSSSSNVQAESSSAERDGFEHVSSNGDVLWEAHARRLQSWPAARASVVDWRRRDRVAFLAALLPLLGAWRRRAAVDHCRARRRRSIARVGDCLVWHDARHWYVCWQVLACLFF